MRCEQSLEDKEKEILEYVLRDDSNDKRVIDWWVSSLPLNLMVGSQESVDLIRNIVDAHSESYYSQVKFLLDFKNRQTYWKVFCLKIVELMFPLTQLVLATLPR